MRSYLAVLALICLAPPAWADALSQRMLDAIQAPRLLAQLALEAEQSAQEIDQDFLAGAGGTFMADTVTRLNDPQRLLPRLEAEMIANMARADMEAVVSFLESPLGGQLADLELSAREAMFDPEVDAAVRERVAQTGVPKLVEEIIRDSDLIERNVLDSLLILEQFYLGRRAGGMTDLSEQAIGAFTAELAGDVRTETGAWLRAFMTLAYSPLSDAELQTYATFWKTEAGQAYDRALFASFKSILLENNFALGQLVGRMQASDEI